ncbi:MAG TPA: LysM peptidoglycan-binding domain-containing protein [Psychromonas hadalis]|nr:LysM peptidoglycan-binding domain-containing protein [Psychromonas hadalis]
MNLVNTRTLRSFFFSALMIVVITNSAFANTLKSVRAFPSPDNTRVVFDLSSKPSYEIHYLSKPNRLVIDFNNTKNKFNLKKLKHKGPLVKGVRNSRTSKSGVYRVVIDLSGQSKARTFVLSANKSYKYHRLIFDLPHNKKKEMAKKVTAPPKKQKLRDVVIAIDAGHGGEDPGALGRYTQEKKVTLQIAKRLQKRINQQKGMRAFLTRKGDYYLSLTKRTEIAVNKNADFFVSIHADGFTSSQPKGASVWVSSERRTNSTAAALMRKQERESQRLGGEHSALLSNLVSGEDVVNDSNLQVMLMGMAQSKRSELAYIRGGFVLNELRRVTYLHKKKPQKASLAVLRMPYFPSILVEAGFITHHGEEKLLNSPAFQNKISDAIFKGIYKFYTDYPPPKTVFYNNQRIIKHSVRTGESLSIIAKNYHVKQSSLKSLNSLKSTKLHVGQVIKIPKNYQVSTDYNVPVNRHAIQYKEELIHKVTRGESLSLIAQRYGKTISQLKSYNKLRSTSLAVGQKIKIPHSRSTAVIAKQKKVPTKPLIYKVKRGESLSVIAHRYGYTSSDLKRFNNLSSKSLQVGQKLKIPTGVVKRKPAPIKTKTIVYTVKRGDSLSVIAHRYGYTSTDLKRINNLRSKSLRVGQKLKIPNVKASPAKKRQQVLVHKVKKGQSLSLIASFYGKTSRELMAYNKLKKSSVWAGQKIKVPLKSKVFKKHKVKSGESLSRIAHRYGVKSSTLKSFNNLRSSSLAIGQVLTIPVS